MAIAERKRTANLMVRMLPDERAELDALADVERSTASDVVRRLIRAAYVQQFGARKTRAKR